MFGPAGDESGDDDLMFCSDYQAQDDKEVEEEKSVDVEMFATPATSNTTGYYCLYLGIFLTMICILFLSKFKFLACLCKFSKSIIILKDLSFYSLARLKRK